MFRAWDAELQREVALKLLRDEGVSGSAPANARLLQEARRLARIRHPHVVHVYGAERHEERIGLWMELVRGRSLDEIVRQDGPIDVRRGRARRHRSRARRSPRCTVPACCIATSKRRTSSARTAGGSC